MTLQYAHRRCVQRWCNEKGDTICEICHQVGCFRRVEFNSFCLVIYVCLYIYLSIYVIEKIVWFQQFKPGYTVPPPLFQFGRIPMHFRWFFLFLVVRFFYWIDFEVECRFHYSTLPICTNRGNWEISRRDINSPRIIAMVSSSDRNFLDPEFDDYSASSTRSLTCCRIVAVIVS